MGERVRYNQPCPNATLSRAVTPRRKHDTDFLFNVTVKNSYIEEIKFRHFSRISPELAR